MILAPGVKFLSTVQGSYKIRKWLVILQQSYHLHQWELFAWQISIIGYNIQRDIETLPGRAVEEQTFNPRIQQEEAGGSL